MTVRAHAPFPALAAGALLLAACGRQAPSPVTAPAPDSPETVVVQGFRDANSEGMVAALDAWRAATGNGYRLLSDETPGGAWRNDPSVEPEADLVIAGSLAEVWTVAEADSLRPVFSAVVDANIDAAFRDPEARWVALSRRARVVAYNTKRVTEDELAGVDSYASLGDERWRERLCASSSAVPGNRALIAFLISRHGVREAELIVRRWRENFATPVLADDRALLDAIADGRCGAGVVDTAIVAAVTGAQPGRPLAVHWFPDATNTLTDISAAAVSRHAGKPDAARALLEWLTGKDGNALFAGRGFEFPVAPGAALASAVGDWSERLPQDARYAELGFLLEDAKLLSERARYP